MRQRVNLIIIGLLIGCSSTNSIKYADNALLSNIKNAVSLETKLNSIDKTPLHLVGISTGIYPNKSNFILATPRTFVRKEDFFEKEVSYYYSTSDSLVKVILYQWDKRDEKSFETKNEKEQKFKEFQRKWTTIEKSLRNELGKPTFEEIESTKFPKGVIKEPKLNEDELWDTSKTPETSWTDKLKWENGGETNAYLFMFGDNRTGYRQIRLAVYGE